MVNGVHKITREEAIARLEREPIVACRLCAILDTRDQVLAEAELASVIVSRFPVRWGQLIVIPHAHVERFSEVSPLAWAETSMLAFRAASVIERVLSPSRCYVASLGTSERGVPMSFPHLHVNVIPVHDPSERPREVLTWQHGVLDADPAAWRALYDRLRDAWG
jgi:diadenosine tetraphosphate (Ap4A) HIT family hydrolase